MGRSTPPCECALTRATQPVWKSGAVFKGEPAHVRGLTRVPFDVACLGNNHVLDYGLRGPARDAATCSAGTASRPSAPGMTEEEACAPAHPVRRMA